MSDPASVHGVPNPGKESPLPSGTAGSVVFAAKLLTFCLLAALLYWGRVVAIPLSLAILLSFTLKPVVRGLQRCHLPRVVAVVATVTLACGVLGGFGWVIGAQLVELSGDLPSYRDNMAEKIRTVRAMMRGGTVEKLQGTMETLAAELKEEKADAAAPEPMPQDVHAGQPEEPPAVPVYLTSPKRLFNVEAIGALLPVVDPLTTAALVLILVILILLRWDDLRGRIISFSGHHNLSTATRACDDAGHRISRYLILQLLLNGSYGLVFAAGLYFIGVPYAALWGLCAGLFRYLPYVGPVIGGVLPVLFSLITSDGWSQPLWVGGLLLGLELVSNNVLEPWLYGSQLGLSEVGLIIAAVAWTFLWGPVGLLLATPMTVCLVVLGQYIPAFSVFTRLLGDSPVLAPPHRLYQRIFAGDPIEATEIACNTVARTDLPAAIDELLLPTLALADRDQVAGLLEEEDEERIAGAFKKLFSEMLAVAGEPADWEANPVTGGVSAVIWPLSPMAACAVPWMRWLLREADCEVIALSPDTLSAEAATLVQEKYPAVFCLLGLSAASVRRERQLAKRLAALSSGAPLVACRAAATEAADAADPPGIYAAIARSLGKTCGAMRPLIQQAALAEPESDARGK